MKLKNFNSCFYMVLAASVTIISCKNEEGDKGIQERPKNVLFIMVDDLRPELGCYGERQVHSPNLDRFAAEGIMFQRAYCNVPTCGASRSSCLTGLRPTRHHFVTHKDWADTIAPNVTCLSQHFKNHGYYTISRGKVFHHMEDRSESWDENWRPETRYRDYQIPENILMQKEGDRNGPAFESAPVHDTVYRDGKLANKAIEDLKRLKEMDMPFFLAVGFFKPHLPFNAPTRYWNLYDHERIRLPQNEFKPIDAPDEAMHNWGELRSYGNIPREGKCNDSLARVLIHGYYAAISYIDVQIGRVLDALEETGQAESTMVIIFGDHGWNLREHGLWCKHCNFRTSFRCTVMIKDPEIKGGKQTDALIEYIDIYPTLCDLCDLPLPDHLEGESFVPVLKDPMSGGKKRLICRWRSGFSIKTDQYIYTEWNKSESNIYARMLFNHRVDLDETKNVAFMPQNEELIEALSAELHENWGENFNKKGIIP